MNTASGLALYLVGSFVMVAAFVVTPSIKYYLGAVVIFLFMGGVFYAWLNTIRQTQNMLKTPTPTASDQQGEKKSGEAVMGSATTTTQEPQKQATG